MSGDSPSLGRQLKQAEQSLIRAKSAAVRPAGLTLPQYVALAELEANPGLTGSSLARACLVTPQAMAVALAKMEEGGLVSRSPHPRHSAVIEVSLTDTGVAALADARDRAEPVEQRIAAAFTQDELSTLQQLLARMVEAIERP